MMKVMIVLMALVVLAAAFDQEEAEVDFIKRDPVLQDYFMAEKRGQSMRKYKVCDTQFSSDQTCWCSRRNGKFAFCAGAAGGEGI